MKLNLKCYCLHFFSELPYYLCNFMIITEQFYYTEEKNGEKKYISSMNVK